MNPKQAAKSALSWQIGHVRVTRVIELSGPGLRFIIPEAIAENCRNIPWLFPHFVTPEGKPVANVQTFIIESQDQRIAVDTCVGNDKTLPIDFWSNLNLPFLHDLEAAGFPRESIDTVLCTHLHPDHVGWNTMLQDGRWIPTFPNASYLFGRKEYAHLTETVRQENATLIEQSVQPVLDAGLHTLVETDHKLTGDVWLEHTPGHTPGHVSVRIHSDGLDAVITGDVMHHPAQILHPEWKVLPDADRAQARRTREDFIERHADTPTLIIGSHFAGPTAGRIIRENGAFRFTV